MYTKRCEVLNQVVPVPSIGATGMNSLSIASENRYGFLGLLNRNTTGGHDLGRAARLRGIRLAL
jgi:hypothetical protein